MRKLWCSLETFQIVEKSIIPLLALIYREVKRFITNGISFFTGSYSMSNDDIIEVICELRCQYCGELIRSELQFGNAESYFATSPDANFQICPICKKMTGMNKSNMRFGERRSDGRVTYVEGEDIL